MDTRQRRADDAKTVDALKDAWNAIADSATENDGVSVRLRRLEGHGVPTVIGSLEYPGGGGVVVIDAHVERASLVRGAEVATGGLARLHAAATHHDVASDVCSVVLDGARRDAIVADPIGRTRALAVELHASMADRLIAAVPRPRTDLRPGRAYADRLVRLGLLGPGAPDVADPHRSAEVLGIHDLILGAGDPSLVPGLAAHAIHAHAWAILGGIRERVVGSRELADAFDACRHAVPSRVLTAKPWLDVVESPELRMLIVNEVLGIRARALAKEAVDDFLEPSDERGEDTPPTPGALAHRAAVSLLAALRRAWAVLVAVPGHEELAIDGMTAGAASGPDVLGTVRVLEQTYLVHFATMPPEVELRATIVEGDEPDQVTRTSRSAPSSSMTLRPRSWAEGTLPPDPRSFLEAYGRFDPDADAMTGAAVLGRILAKTLVGPMCHARAMR